MIIDDKDISAYSDTDDSDICDTLKSIKEFNIKDFLVISRDSAKYHFFKVFVIICGCISSLVYAYFAAFRKDINTGISEDSDNQ